MSLLKYKHAAIQFFLYGFVGFLSCCIDFSCFLFFRWIETPLIASFMIAFIVATICNYLMSRTFIFAPKSDNSYQQIARIFFVATIGLILSTLFFSLLNHFTSIDPLWNKVLIIPLVVFWNFWGRRTLVFSSGIPVTTLSAINKLFKI